LKRKCIIRNLCKHEGETKNVMFMCLP
jgi:hypothetical protein